MSFYREDERSRLKDQYEKRIEQEQARIGELELDGAAIAAQESQWASRNLLLTEKNHVLDSFRQGVFDQEIYEKLLADIAHACCGWNRSKRKRPSTSQTLTRRKRRGEHTLWNQGQSAVRI